MLSDLAVGPWHRSGDGERHQLVEETHRAEQMERNVVGVRCSDHTRCRVAFRVVRAERADIVQEERGASGEIEAHRSVDRPLHHGRVEGSSIGEGHSLPQVEGVVLPVGRDPAVRDRRNLRGQPRQQGGRLRVVYQQGVEDLVDDFNGHEVVGTRRIQTDDVVRGRRIENRRPGLVDDEPLVRDRMEFHVLDTVHVRDLGGSREEGDVGHVLRKGGLDFREPVRPNRWVARAGLISNPLVDLGVVVEGSFGFGTGNRQEWGDVIVGVEVVRIPAEQEQGHLLVYPPRLVRGPDVGLEGHLDLAT